MHINLVSWWCSYPVHYHFGEVFNSDIIVINEFTVANNLVDFCFAHSLPHGHHGMLEVSYCYFSIMVAIEHFESIHEVLQSLLILATFLHDFLENVESETSLAFGVHFLLHISDFCFCGVQIEGSYQGAQFTCGYLASIAFVEQSENLFYFI